MVLDSVDSVDGLPDEDDLVVDLRSPFSEAAEREMAKARHPSNAERSVGQASSG